MRQQPGFRRSPSRRPDIGVALLTLVLAGGACTSSTEHTFRDQGQICLVPPGTTLPLHQLQKDEPRSYQADRALEVRVVIPSCLSTTCSHDARATCAVAVDGNRIEVTSAGSYRETTGACSADCQILEARCQTPALPPGTYQVAHGDTTLTLAVPSTVAAPCGGRGNGITDL